MISIRDSWRKKINHFSKVCEFENLGLPSEVNESHLPTVQANYVFKSFRDTVSIAKDTEEYLEEFLKCLGMKIP